ncbi:MAG: hypothetical protein IPJ40_06465 [Saprospirales bacterium]|nr:hypothetical protein [Saprospirales bacterium]
MQALKFLLLFLLPSFFAACNSDTSQNKVAETASGNATTTSNSGKQELMFVLADQAVSPRRYGLHRCGCSRFY